MWGSQNLNSGQADSKDIVAVFILSFVIWWFNAKSLRTVPPMHVSPCVLYFFLFRLCHKLESFFQESKFTSSGYGKRNRGRPIWEWCSKIAKRKAGRWVNKPDLSFWGNPEDGGESKLGDQNLENGASVCLVSPGWMQKTFIRPGNSFQHPTDTQWDHVALTGDQLQP